MIALPYLRNSTAKQAGREFAWACQEEDCQEYADRHGLTLLPSVRDPARTAATLARPGLLEALQRLADDEADALIVGTLEHLTRDVADLAQLFDWFDDVGKRLVIVQFPPMDPLSPDGREYARTRATYAQSERERISARTSRAMRAKRNRGEDCGRPSVPPEVAERIRQMHADGMSYEAICKQLNAEGVPTARGGKCWRPSSLQTVLGYERPRRRRTRVELPKPTPRKRKRRKRKPGS